ncbi:hypothetical protein [Tsukamurella hominis]|uniref:hypothetical protein n=1 Tax=Tsukamurella hominis TaxID=1970232 RepID=UPI0039ECEAC1
MESDLSRYHGIDYRDRWRFDENGCRRLTIRMIGVRITTLPADSALNKKFRDGATPWTLTDHLLADLVERLAGIKYLARPGANTEQDEKETRRENRRAGALKRAERQRARRGQAALPAQVLAAVETAQRNARPNDPKEE